MSPILNHELFFLVWEIWLNPPTTKSDFARAHTNSIALAASVGWITTLREPWSETHGNVWRVSPEGLLHLWAYAERHKEVLYQYVTRTQTVHQEQD